MVDALSPHGTAEGMIVDQASKGSPRFRVEENGQTTETIEEDGRLTSRKVNGILQAIK